MYLIFLFTTFCLAILINGSNFIDGLNGLLIGYYLLINLSSIFYISFNNDYIFLLDFNFLASFFFLWW